MASYFQQDIQTYDDGEFDISSGDLALASSRQSQRQLLINILSTTRGGFRFDSLIGWGAENYMGKKNTLITHELMTQDLRTALRTIDDLATEDIDFVVSLLSEEAVAIVLRHSGLFYEDDGTIVNDPLVLGWRLSFLTGQIEPETE